MGIVGKHLFQTRTASATRLMLYLRFIVAGYGLSAFLYASISGLIIGDNTELFLLVLAIGTFASLFGAGILLTNTRMEHAYSLLPGGSPVSPERTLLRRSSRSRSRSTASADTAGEGILEGLDETEELDELEEEGDHPRGRQSQSNPSLRIGGSSHKKQSSILVKQAIEAKERNKQDNIMIETGSLGLFKVPDYYLLMIVAFCCTGTGIMWINSVGTVVGKFQTGFIRRT